jgi:hypothetical protein
MNNSDEGETPPKRDRRCADKLPGPSRVSYASTTPYCGSRIFKINPGFIPRHDASEIVDLKLGEAPEKFPRNLVTF